MPGDEGEGAVTQEMSIPTTRPPQPGIRLHVDLGGDPRPHRSAKIEAHLRVDVAADGAPIDLPAVQLAVMIAVDVAESNRAAVRHALPAALRALPDRISFTVLGSGPQPVRCFPRDDDEWAVADQGYDAGPRSCRARSRCTGRRRVPPGTPPGWPVRAPCSPAGRCPYAIWC
ncbi:hypothetical protein SHKM778_27260 [Streptomyces sp. KM77-8]|uniref:VWFA domain-containing protein n=1 Tax=Streptomyces haneummycinicus TaxID=3074435 RepID=A0AAT9HFS0_9ACTN